MQRCAFRKGTELCKAFVDCTHSPVCVRHAMPMHTKFANARMEFQSVCVALGSPSVGVV